MTELEKQQPKLKKKIFSQKQKELHRIKLGLAGERLAAAFLKQKGYCILAQNSRVKNAEVDLIALDTKQNEIVFVEVKTRKTDAFGNPSEAVTPLKLRAMQQVARIYLTNTHCTKDYRFDTIAVIGNKIEHFENITWP